MSGSVNSVSNGDRKNLSRFRPSRRWGSRCHWTEL